VTPRRRSRSSRAASSLLLALAVLLVLTMSANAQDEAAAQPDIVVIYLDDVDPHDARLWKNEGRTPTLSRLFARSGVQFTRATSETPLCSPGRAATLTGRHTANHGVDDNVAAPFDPRVTLATELDRSGYETIFVGKYLNQLRTEVKPHQLRRHARGWDEFDVIYEDNGKYFDYAMWSPEGGRERFGKGRSDHSTLVAKRKLVEHLKAAPKDEPLFAFASLYDVHAPNLPAAKYDGVRKCRRIKDWAPPSYAASVKGKPRFIRERRQLKRPGWPMQTYCEEMLAVEELAKAVVREQRRRGRLEDTLFILTADNGVAWGIHRLPQRKGVPYATPIPLVFHWPARWGSDVTEIDEVVSNIDVAPTICAIAGCEIGPFREGPETADGLSLLPLLDGEAESLERTLVREESGPGYPSAPRFWAVRTTTQHPLGLWHYTEWETGERELYDSLNDPWELDNLARGGTHDDIVAQLSAELEAEFFGPATEQPGPPEEQVEAADSA
jgi:arylsulfatase A-like enzyme